MFVVGDGGDPQLNVLSAKMSRDLNDGCSLQVEMGGPTPKC